MSIHYYEQFEEFKDPKRTMKDVYYGIFPYLNFNRTVKEFLEKESAIKFKVRYLEQAPDFEEFLKQKDQAQTEEEKQKITELIEGNWYELDENPHLEKSNRLLETIFSEEYFYQNVDNGRWRPENKVNVLLSDVDQLIFCLDKEIQGDYLFVRPNTTQYWRVIQSIEKLMNSPAKFHAPLLRLFETNIHEVDWPDFDPMEIENYYFIEDGRSGSELQKEFVQLAMGTPDFALLNGPPGTGKTQVICEIIIQEILRGKKIMLVASTHVAVDNVLERLMSLPIAQQTVFPIRIGRSGKISLDNKKYSLNEVGRTERKRISNHLQKLRERSQSQQILYEALQKDRHVIDAAILDATNLVCGTTIGILQYPHIKHFQGNKSRALFDLLILDEASKTPFYEFIVPAIWASRWILTGDPKQLSPYVDDYDVHTSIKAIVEGFPMETLNEQLNAEEKLVALDSLLPYLDLKQITSKTRNLKYKILVFSDDSLLDFHRNHVMTLKNTYPDFRVLNIDDLLPYLDNPLLIETMVYSSQIIVVSQKNLSQFADFIPSDVEMLVIGSNEISLPAKLRRRKIPHKIFETDDDDFNWINQIAFRLGRRFELRDDPEAQTKKNEEITKILPIEDKIIQKIKEVEQVFFPSVLESLLIGFERKNIMWGSTITDGLPEKAKKQRFRLLKCQHRMHPEISKFIREEIYQKQSMLDAFEIREMRSDWRSGSRISWTHVKRKVKKNHKEPTDNDREVKAIIDDLKEFLKWAEQTDKVITVAVLTFYRAQERKIRNSLRRLFHQKNRIRYFKKKNVHLQLCTVDRFQGHEADIVFLSMVNNTRMGFLNSPNRLNVALSRARYELRIYGNHGFFKTCRSKLLRRLAKSVPVNKRYKEGTK